MNKFKIYLTYIASIILILLMLVSCVDETLNLNQKNITSEQLRIDANEGGFMLPGMMQSILAVDEPWNYEFQQNLSIDHYAGYMAFPAAFFANRTTATYHMVVQWNNPIWGVPSSRILDRWVSMKNQNYDEAYPDLFSIATILKSIAGLRMTDTFGPIPYSQYGTQAEVEFDSGEQVYNTIFEELKESVNTLKQFEEEQPGAWQIRFSKFDNSEYSGDYQKWIRLANTIRLRMALRISNVDPERARVEAESAVSSGVLTGADGDFGVRSSTGRHPLDIITKDWQETRLGAPVETILKGYNDPRLNEYALPATYPDVEGEIKGVRTGVPFPTSNAYMPFSQVKFENNEPVKLVSAAESYFLRAEGALYGWDMGGSAREFYEEGIRVSFAAVGVGGSEEYLNDNTSTPIEYVDPINPDNNAPPLTSITIQWEEGATIDENLERIITQKWIAMYPEGMEAWSEFRRTGFPNLYPIRVNESGGQIADGDFIKRMSYPDIIRNSSPNTLQPAIDQYLDGEDSLAKRLWWDVN
jgi:hypothetical protein